MRVDCFLAKTRCLVHSKKKRTIKKIIRLPDLSGRSIPSLRWSLRADTSSGLRISLCVVWYRRRCCDLIGRPPLPKVYPGISWERHHQPMKLRCLHRERNTSLELMAFHTRAISAQSTLRHATSLAIRRRSWHALVAYK